MTGKSGLLRVLARISKVSTVAVKHLVMLFNRISAAVSLGGIVVASDCALGIGLLYSMDLWTAREVSLTFILISPTYLLPILYN
jgi:hypothetical protein